MTHTTDDDLNANWTEKQMQEMIDQQYAKLKELYPNFDKLSDTVQQKLLSDTQLEQTEMAELLGCSVEDLREADAFWNELAPRLRDKFFALMEAQRVGTPDLIVCYDLKTSELSKVLDFDDPECIFNDPSLEGKIIAGYQTDD